MGIFKKKEKSNDPKFWDTLSGPTKGTVIAAVALKTAKWGSIVKDIIDANNGCDCIEDSEISDVVADATETI